MKNSDIEELEAVDTRCEKSEKLPATAYQGDHVTGVHEKSPVEKRLLLKARGLLVTLSALMYFAAYLVHPSPFLTLLQTLIRLSAGSTQHWQRVCHGHGKRLEHAKG